MKAYLVFDDSQFHTSLHTVDWSLYHNYPVMWVFIYAKRWALKPETDFACIHVVLLPPQSQNDLLGPPGQERSFAILLWDYSNIT